MKCIITISIFLFIAIVKLSAQDTERLIQKGNELHKQQKYREAELVYNEVLEKDPSNNTAKYNKAITFHKQAKPDESIKAFEDLAFKTENKDIREKSYYNKGAVLSGQKKLEESIEAYKNALRHDANDNEARENLQKALLELKKKNPPKKDDKKKQQQQQQKQQQKPQPKMNQKEAEQRLKLLEQKEREVQQRLQKEKSKTGGGQPKDW